LVGNLPKPIKNSHMSKNNIYYFILLFYFIILTCILLFAYSSHFKLMIFYNLNHQINYIFLWIQSLSNPFFSFEIWATTCLYSFQLRMTLQKSLKIKNITAGNQTKAHTQFWSYDLTTWPFLLSWNKMECKIYVISEQYFFCSVL